MATKEENIALSKIREQRFIDAANYKEPDYVPILSQVNAFAIGYAGHTAEEVFNSEDVERECYIKACDGFSYDGLFMFGLNHPFKTYIELGSPTYFVSDNGVTIQHQESSQMNADEYDEFIADPIAFIANKVGARKVKGLAVDYPQSYDNYVYLNKSLAQFKKNGAYNKQYVAETLGIPVVASGSLPNPFDNFFDFIRGFKGTVVDMRRDIDKVDAAIKALTPYYTRNLPNTQLPQFPWRLNTAHCPTFISTKQFERLYWPYFKASVDACHEFGPKYMCFMEGDWTRYYDLMDDLAPNTFIGVLEYDDIRAFKKRFQGKHTVAGGIQQIDLRSKSFEECKDIVKGVYDDCAAGGGFIFTTEKALIDPKDVDPELLKQVNAFAHEYGKRK